MPRSQTRIEGQQAMRLRSTVLAAPTLGTRLTTRPWWHVNVIQLIHHQHISNTSKLVTIQNNYLLLPCKSHSAKGWLLCPISFVFTFFSKSWSRAVKLASNIERHAINWFSRLKLNLVDSDCPSGFLHLSGANSILCLEWTQSERCITDVCECLEVSFA